MTAALPIYYVSKQAILLLRAATVSPLHVGKSRSYGTKKIGKIAKLKVNVHCLNFKGSRFEEHTVIVQNFFFFFISSQSLDVKIRKVFVQYVLGYYS